MSMSQTVREITSEAGSTPISIPRQYGRELLPAPVPAPAPADPQPVLAGPELDVRPFPRRARSRWTIGVDAVLALVLGVTAAAVGALPMTAALVGAAAWPLLLLAAGHYRHGTLGGTRAAHVGVVLMTGVRAGVLALALSPWLPSTDLTTLGALVAILSVASTVPALVVVRRPRPRLVLAGRPRDVREAMAELITTNTHEVVAACLTRSPKVPLGDLATYVGFADAAEVASRHDADAVVVLPGARLPHVEVRRLHWSLAGVGAELYLGTGLLDVEPQRTRVVSTAGIDVLHVTDPVLDGPRRLLKDLVERIVALVALVVAAPLLAALCIAIRRESPGPALFRQERIGRDGVPFTMLKLRSMGVDAETAREALTEVNEHDGVLFKIRADPRITPLGARLRRYSLDELPQLWNVVRGDMSLVGPRPALPCEVARYDVDPRRRLVVKPGVTGLWQVSGRSDLSWAESVRLDLKYVENWSLGLDLRILARTVRAVLGHRGAY